MKIRGGSCQPDERTCEDDMHVYVCAYIQFSSMNAQASNGSLGCSFHTSFPLMPSIWLSPVRCLCYYCYWFWLWNLLGVGKNSLPCNNHGTPFFYLNEEAIETRHSSSPLAVQVSSNQIILSGMMGRQSVTQRQRRWLGCTSFS